MLALGLRASEQRAQPARTRRGPFEMLRLKRTPETLEYRLALASCEHQAAFVGGPVYYHGSVTYDRERAASVAVASTGGWASASAKLSSVRVGSVASSVLMPAWYDSKLRRDDVFVWYVSIELDRARLDASVIAELNRCELELEPCYAGSSELATALVGVALVRKRAAPVRPDTARAHAHDHDASHE